MEGHNEGFCADRNVLPGAIPSEGKFRTMICSVYEAAWMGFSTEQG